MRSFGLFASLLIASGQVNAQNPPGGARSQGEPGRQASVTDYAVLDNTPAVYTNFNVESVRPMVTTPDGAILYALNTHANFVAVFHDASGQPAERFATPLAPVAVALWDDDLIVACAVSSTPSDATSDESGEALRSGRKTTSSTATPTATVPASAAGNAPAVPSPSVRSQRNR